MIRDTQTQKCKQYAWPWMSRGEVLPHLISMLLPVASISGLEAGSQSATLMSEFLGRAWVVEVAAKREACDV